MTLGACSSSEPTENEATLSTSTSKQARCEPAKPMLGAWEDASVTLESKQAAVLAATSMTGHSLKEVHKVEQQVVEGINYKVTFTVEDGSSFMAMVHRSLDGEYELLSVQPEDLVQECSEEE